MHYLIMLHFRDGAGPQEGTPELDAEMQRWGELNEEMKQAGVLVAASGLEVEAVTTVRKRDGDVAVTDGPYAETKEVLFSFYILDVADLDEATKWAAQMPSAEYGSNEVRPMVHYQLA